MTDNPTSQRITRQIAGEINAAPAQVAAATALLNNGATVPFIARYRKEATGGLDDGQLRTLQVRLDYLRELEARRAVVLASIGEQGKLSDALRSQLMAADTKAGLEDLYLPYRPRRRTRAQAAREAGLQPLAVRLLGNPQLVPEQSAQAFVDASRGVADVAAALEGARAILIEQWCENAALLGQLRQWLGQVGLLHSSVAMGKQEVGSKYRDYFDHRESLGKIAAHRLLALLRARAEEVVTLQLEPGNDVEAGHQQALATVARHAGVQVRGRAADAWLFESCRQAWRNKLHPQLFTDLLGTARDKAQKEAITVFAANLGDLLLAAPAGPQVVMGIDPGIRTGCKLAVVDANGKLLATDTIYPHEPRRQWQPALAVLTALCKRHQVSLIAIGNGTGGRETDTLVAELLAALPAPAPLKVMVSEAGASVYSASEMAAREFPQLDVSLRGAVSIARRLQDPLAELVKIEPRAIGVGQYQHDVDQVQLAQALQAKVEDCVNAVGVEVNTASAPLLARVAGVSAVVAANIVAYRDQNGPFRRRRDLLKVARLGERTFEQCAGFLRIAGGEQPMDASAVHPESYPVVERIVAAAGKPVQALIGDVATLRALPPERFTDARFGLPTVRDILLELEKPGRDPRPGFAAVRFADAVHTLADLKVGMILEGVVSNVAAFGAFVDIGVHQDGLVHISQLADSYIKDPRSVVKAGDIVKVRVLEVDVARKRIALSRRLTPEQSEKSEKSGKPESKAAVAAPAAGQGRGRQRPTVAATPAAPQPAGAMALALARAHDGRS